MFKLKSNQININNKINNKNRGEIIKINSPSMFIGNNDKDITSFGSGQPDKPPPKEVMDSNHICFRDGLIQGEDSLRSKLSKIHNIPKDDFVITKGASKAIFLLLAVLLKPGYKVLLTKPFYYSYVELVKQVHAKPLFTELKDGQIDIKDFESKIKEGKLSLINSPMNPTGVVI